MFVADLTFHATTLFPAAAALGLDDSDDDSSEDAVAAEAIQRPAINPVTIYVAWSAPF